MLDVSILQFTGVDGTNIAKAMGCEQCVCGIRRAPQLTGRDTVRTERRAQYLAGHIEFCDCWAGQMYHKLLSK